MYLHISTLLVVREREIHYNSRCRQWHPTAFLKQQKRPENRIAFLCSLYNSIYCLHITATQFMLSTRRGHGYIIRSREPDRCEFNITSFTYSNGPWVRHFTSVCFSLTICKRAPSILTLLFWRWRLLKKKKKSTISGPHQVVNVWKLLLLVQESKNWNDGSHLANSHSPSQRERKSKNNKDELHPFPT